MACAVATAASFGATPASPASAASPPFTQCPALGGAATCDVLITINGDGSSTVAVDPAIPPFDGSDDMIVGVQNDGARPVTDLAIVGASDVFGFDSDGLCTFITCTWSAPTGYEGPLASFAPDASTATKGTVHFTSLLAPGGSTYFSLEGAPSASSVTTATPGTVVHPAPSIDPAFFSPSRPHLTVGVATPPPLIAPNGQVINPGPGRTAPPTPPAVSKPLCDPGSDSSFLNVFKVTITCLGSFQAFSDPQLAPKDVCLANLLLDVIPIGKLTIPAKAAAKLTKAGKALATALKATKIISLTDKRFINGLDTLGTLFGIIKDPKSIFQVLATDDTVLNGIRKALGTGKGTATALARLTATEKAAGDIVTLLTGAQDVITCVQAFK